MNNYAKKSNLFLKCGTEIKVLSVIALVCIIINCFSAFCYYDYDLCLNFGIPSVYSLFSAILAVAAIVMFVLYIFAFRKKWEADFLIPAVYGVFILKVIISFIYEAYNYSLTFLYVIVVLLAVVAYILALIGALKGFAKKTLFVIAMCILALFEALTVYVYIKDLISYIDYHLYFYIVAAVAGLIGSLAFYIAQFIFGVKNTLPRFCRSTVNQNSNDVDFEKELLILKDKYELNMISEEEYNAKKAEIISKL